MALASAFLGSFKRHTRSIHSIARCVLYVVSQKSHNELPQRHGARNGAERTVRLNAQ
jgi:hypothetical protein